MQKTQKKKTQIKTNNRKLKAKAWTTSKSRGVYGI